MVQQSKQHARSLCNLSPMSLWVEDSSGVKRLMDQVRNSGMRDFRVSMNVHSDFLTRCMEQIKVPDVNQHTLVMFGAVHKPFAVMPGHEEKWDLVRVFLADTTARKKA